MPTGENGLPWWFSGKEPACQCQSRAFDPWVGKIPWKRKWQPSPVFLPGKSHGQRSLGGYRPRAAKELDVTERLNSSTCDGLLLNQCSALPWGPRVHRRCGPAGRTETRAGEATSALQLLGAVCRFMAVPVLCLLNTLRFFLGLSGGNLFTDWAKMVASLLGPQPDAVVAVCWTSKKN